MPSYTESAMEARQSRLLDVSLVSDADYQFSRSLRGVPSPGNRTYRASVSSWDRGLRMTRTVGTGFTDYGEPVLLDESGRPSHEFGEPTVKVTLPNGARVYRPVSAFHRTREASQDQSDADMRELAESIADQNRATDMELMARMGTVHYDE